MEVDCSAAGKEICHTHGVKGYPTLKVFKYGQFDTDYVGPRHAGYLVKFTFCLTSKRFL